MIREETDCMKKMLLGLLATLSMLGLTACGSNKEEVDIFQYVNVVFKGDNETGIAEASFHSMEALANEKLKDDTIFISSLKAKAEPNENLKNGDEVKVSIIYDEDAYSELEYKFAETEKTFTVKGLKEYYGADTTLSEDEYHKLSNYILEEGVLKSFGNNVYEDKTNEDGSITNNGVNVKLSFDSMYVADNLKELPKNIYSSPTHSLLAFFKVDYIITEDCSEYKYLNKDKLKGTYYLWVEFFDLAKPNEKGQWSYDDVDCAEHPANKALGSKYAIKLNTNDYHRDSLEDVYGVMDKQELLQFFNSLRNTSFQELKISK